MRGLGATRAETGSESGDQCHLRQGWLPLAFFGCQEVGAGWGHLFSFYLHPSFPVQEATTQSVLIEVRAWEEHGEDGLTLHFYTGDP